jgi:hypothetical protein
MHNLPPKCKAYIRRWLPFLFGFAIAAYPVNIITPLIYPEHPGYVYVGYGVVYITVVIGVAVRFCRQWESGAFWDDNYERSWWTQGRNEQSGQRTPSP